MVSGQDSFCSLGQGTIFVLAFLQERDRESHSSPLAVSFAREGTPIAADPWSQGTVQAGSHFLTQADSLRESIVSNTEEQQIEENGSLP